MEIEGVSRRVLADQVKDRLLEDILSGRYPADARIVETLVARQLGVSQAPVREALRGLEASGVIELSPFRGARVRRPSPEELLQAMQVRSALEVLGAQLAVPNITAANVRTLKRHGDAMRRAAGSGDKHALAVADAAFHATLIELSGNPTLVRVWQSLEPLSRTYITTTTPGVSIEEIAALHWPILEALEHGDVSAVVGALRQHFDSAASKVDVGWRQPPVDGASP